MSLTCAIMITTRNRLENLRQTLEVLQRLAPPADEIMVCADGCTDGTADFIRTLPGVRLLVNEQGIGSIASRDRMVRQTQCDIILSFDDDSQPIESDFVKGVRDLFEKHPRLAVAAYPQLSDEFPDSLTRTNFGPAYFIGSYASSAASIRRSAYLEVGGYSPLFYHVYEEPDFTLRCVAAGWQVKFETSLHVRHYYSGLQRNEMRVHHFQARNEFWSVLINCPAPYVFAVALFRVVRQLNYARKRGLDWLAREPSWWMSCVSGLPGCFAHRKPLPWKSYLRWMQLLRTPIATEEEWNRRFGA
ncbi:MAG TPA: glycosyltransferase [Chthoniobacteraceae bacterium]|nr:glycosyltransferase [Chthoniobacteraceae bacterium]